MITQGHRGNSKRRSGSPDSALNGIVLLGEGGRAQIAVLCSTLGVGCGAMQAGLSGAEDGPVGQPASATAVYFGDRSMAESKAMTTGGGPPRAAIT
jgi:hypothetical protein